MQASHVSTPIKSNVSAIFVAIQLSQRMWLVTMHCPDKDKISHHKLEGGDHAGLLTLIDRMRERAARTLGAVPAAVSCYEAGYDGFWLHRLLMAAGITNHVFDPGGIAGDQRARRGEAAARGWGKDMWARVVGLPRGAARRGGGGGVRPRQAGA